MARHELVEKALAMLKPAVPPPEQGSHEWWTEQWRELAQVKDGLLPDDPRAAPVLSVLAECDGCYKAANLDGFMNASKRVLRLMQFIPEAQVWWEGECMPHRLGSIGPAVVEQVICSDGRLWVWCTWDKTGRWVSESIITKIEGAAR
jgi:hypothetical protein